MSEQISIKVQIGNKQYPLKVDKDQETVILKAATMVNDKIKIYQESYKMENIQDVLSMCSLQLATELIGASIQHEENEIAIQSELASLTKLVGRYTAVTSK